MAGLTLGILRYHLKVFESLEAAVISLLPWLGLIFLSDSIKASELSSLIGSLVIFSLIILFFLFDKHYKKFSWYKSGRIGFSGLTISGLFFLVRTAVAASFPFVLSFGGMHDVYLSGIVAFASFLAVFNLAETKNMRKTKKRKAKKGKPKRFKVIAPKGKDIIAYPAKLVAPVGKFLQGRLKKLEKRKKAIEKEDPFKDTSRIVENASPDTDAAEQFGHARTTAIKDHLDRKMIQTKKALTRVKIGKYGICEDCGEMINTDRLMVYPEATMCAKCQEKREK